MDRAPQVPPAITADSLFRTRARRHRSQHPRAPSCLLSLALLVLLHPQVVAAGWGDAGPSVWLILLILLLVGGIAAGVVFFLRSRRSERHGKIGLGAAAAAAANNNTGSRRPLPQRGSDHSQAQRELEAVVTAADDAFLASTSIKRTPADPPLRPVSSAWGAPATAATDTVQDTNGYMAVPEQAPQQLPGGIYSTVDARGTDSAYSTIASPSEPPTEVQRLVGGARPNPQSPIYADADAVANNNNNRNTTGGGYAEVGMGRVLARLQVLPAMEGDPLEQLPATEQQLWQLSRTQVRVVSELGPGKFGTVFLGQHQAAGASGLARFASLAVVKTLDEDSPRQDKRDFIWEARLLTALHHPNIIRTLGYTTDVEPWRMVLEVCVGGRREEEGGGWNLITLAFLNNTVQYCPYGDMLSFVRKCKQYNLPLDGVEQLGFAVQFVSGYQFLASLGLVMRDIQLQHAVVGRGNTLKIAYFRSLWELQVWQRGE